MTAAWNFNFSMRRTNRQKTGLRPMPRIGGGHDQDLRERIPVVQVRPVSSGWAITRLSYKQNQSSRGVRVKSALWKLGQFFMGDFQTIAIQRAEGLRTGADNDDFLLIGLNTERMAPSIGSLGWSDPCCCYATFPSA
jgi:hypothetical protein